MRAILWKNQMNFFANLYLVNNIVYTLPFLNAILYLAI